MFGLFKKQPKQEIAAPPSGVFSTDIDLRRADSKIRNEKIINALMRMPVVKPVGQDGLMSAMDSKMKEAFDSNIQIAKASFAGIGYGINDQQLSWFVGQSFIGYQVAAYLSQNWLIDKACSMPARDAARHWYELSVNDGTEVDPKIFDYVRKRDKHFRLKENCVQFKRFCRIFGIRVAMFKIDVPNPEEFYTNPFNIDAVKPGSYKGISQIDPYWIYPELDGQAASDPSAINFYEPTWWRINGMRVHTSHLIVIRNDEVPDILKPVYYYGGIPLPQRIAERVYAAERTANEAPMLAMTKRTTVGKLDLSQGISQEQSLDARMAEWVAFRDNYGIKLIGEKEDMMQFDISLSDLDAVIMTQFQIAAAVAEVPGTKMMGTSPKGFNATGEFEMKSYHETLESVQEHDFTPLIERHYELLMKSEIEPMFKTKFEIVPVWNPVDSPTAEQLADLNLKKAQTAALYVNMGALDGEMIFQMLITDENSGFNGITGSAPETPQDDDVNEGDDTENES